MPARVSSPAFVGRNGEMERLGAALDAAAAGTPAVFLVAGEAGVGKTRLGSELAARARGSGFRVLAGGCIALGEGGLPFAPIIEALRPLAVELTPATLEALVGPGRSELARLIPQLGEQAGRAGGDEGGSAQGRLFELLLLFLRRLAALQPLLLVVEDLHWADRSTLDLLRFLVRNLREGPLVLVATYRSDELHRRHPLLPVLTELTRSGRVERLELARFGRDEVAAQLEGIIGAPPDRALVERIYARSEGNAFYAEELLAAGASGERLPSTLREVLLVRAAALSDPAQELLRVASVAGGPVTGALLAAIAGSDEASLLPPFREAVGAGILAVDSAGTGYGFRHALTGEAVADELLPGERTALHAAYARELSRDPGWAGDPARSAAVAAHWTAAHELPRAFAASVSAGLAAERTYAYPEAQARYEQALELWPRVPDAATLATLDRVELLEHAATASDAAGFPSRAIAHLELAIGSVDPAVEPARAGLLRDRLGEAYSVQADSAAALAAHREAVRLIPPDPPSAARARVLAGLGRWLSNEEAVPLLDEAIEVARLAGAREIEADALVSRAVLLVSTELDANACVTALRRARAISLEAGDARGVARTDLYIANSLFIDFGRFEAAATLALDALAEAGRNGLAASSFGVGLAYAAAISLRYLGRWDDAERALGQARLASDEEGVAIDYYFGRAHIDVGRGRFERAHHDLDALARLTERSEGAFNLTYAACIRAELALWESRPLEARAVLAEAAARIATLQPTDIVDLLELFDTFGLRAEADLAGLARTRPAAAALEEARVAGAGFLARMRALGAEVARERPVLMRWVTPYLALAEAEHSRLEGATDPARWASTAAAFDALRMPYERAYALYREGEAQLTTGASRVGAIEPLRTAHAIALDIGAEPLRGEVEALARRGRIDLHRAEPVAAEPVSPLETLGLTPREREVLGLLAAGRTNREIATELFITEKTASVHVSNILGKLGVAHRIEAAAIAHRAGFGSPSA